MCTSPRDAASGVLVTTSDAGRHWRLAPRPGVPFSPGTSDGHGASAVRFADPLHGYLFGPDLWATSDGGRHWVRQRPPGQVMRLETRADQVVALVGHCVLGQSCRSQRLYRVSDGGIQWMPLISPLPGEVVDVVLSSSAINVLVMAPGGQGPVILWRRTAAASWHRIATPCSSMTAWPGALAAWSDQGLALVCAGEPAAGQQMKTFYSSSDGGRHWHLVNAGGSYSGYVGGLAAASSRSWAFAEARGGLRVSHDGGRSWSYATFSGRAANVEGWGFVQFTDALHAVAVPWTLNGAVLAITADGGRSWQAVAFPVGY